MATSKYLPPVDQLLTYGDAHDNIADWSGYLSLGIGVEHIPMLIQMLEDESLFTAESGGVEDYAVVHVWRTLSELKAEAAIPVLLSVLSRWGDEEPWWDWLMEELPVVFQTIGSTAIPALRSFMADSTQSDSSRSTAIGALKSIGQQFLESRLQCIEGITQQLQKFTENSADLNAYLIGGLIDLKAIESVAVMEQAFQQKCVEESIVGDWDEVQVDLGLKTREEVPLKRYYLDPSPYRSPSESEFELGHSGGGVKKTKAKTKRKQQKESRKKNRKKK
jgi:Protein of unknown function (DUF1186)